MGNAKLPISWKWAAAEQNGAKLGTQGVLYKVNVQLLALWPMVRFHAQIWQF